MQQLLSGWPCFARHSSAVINDLAVLLTPARCAVLCCVVNCCLTTDQEYISWWSSKIAVCSVNSQTLQPVACEDYDPRDWKECEWSVGFEGEGGYKLGGGVRGSRKVAKGWGWQQLRCAGQLG